MGNYSLFGGVSDCPNPLCTAASPLCSLDLVFWLPVQLVVAIDPTSSASSSIDC